MRLSVRLVAATAIAVAGGAVPAAAAPGALVGTGTASTLSCTTGPIAIEGINITGSTWVFHITAENHTTIGCADAASTVITGTWNPATGGIIATGTGTLSLGAVPSTGVPTTASISVCFLTTPICYGGSVSAIRE